MVQDTLMIFMNATGDFKGKMNITGKTWPRDIPRIRDGDAWTENYDYTRNGSGWLAGDDFINFFFNFYVPQFTEYLRREKLPICGILLCDNCAAHPTDLHTDDGAFRCIFLPPRTTSLIQPCDQHVIYSIKQKYNKRLKRKSRRKAIENKTTQRIEMRGTTNNERFTLLGDAWNDVSQEEIVSSWENLLGEDFIENWEVNEKGSVFSHLPNIREIGDNL